MSESEKRPSPYTEARASRLGWYSAPSSEAVGAMQRAIDELYPVGAEQTLQRPVSVVSDVALTRRSPEDEIAYLRDAYLKQSAQTSCWKAEAERLLQSVISLNTRVLMLEAQLAKAGPPPVVAVDPLVRATSARGVRVGLIDGR